MVQGLTCRGSAEANICRSMMNEGDTGRLLRYNHLLAVTVEAYEEHARECC